MKVLLIGASGFLGSNLLFSKSDYYWVPTYFNHKINHPDATSLDVSNKKSVRKIIFQENPDVIIHVAGMTRPAVCEKYPELSYDVNVRGIHNIVSIARNEDIRLIYLSSDLVFDGIKTLPYREKDATNPTSIYGKHKFEAETIIRNEIDNYLIIRSGIMYGWGPRYAYSLANWVLEDLKKGNKVHMFSDQFRNMTYVGDVVEFISLMITKGYCGILHYASRECRSKFEFGIEFAKIFGFDENLVKRTRYTSISDVLIVPSRIHLDVSKTEEIFGDIPQGIKGGLESLYKQYTDGYENLDSSIYCNKPLI